MELRGRKVCLIQVTNPHYFKCKLGGCTVAKWVKHNKGTLYLTKASWRIILPFSFTCFLCQGFGINRRLLSPIIFINLPDDIPMKKLARINHTVYFKRHVFSSWNFYVKLITKWTPSLHYRLLRSAIKSFQNKWI